MKTLINRILSPTPGWFKGIIKLALTLAAAGGALLVAKGQIPGFVLSPFLVKMAQYFVVAGIVAGAVAKTAKEDTTSANAPAPNGSSGVSSMPVVLILIGLCCILFSGCSRKVALNKSTEDVSLQQTTNQLTKVDSATSISINKTTDSTGESGSVKDSTNTNVFEIHAKVYGRAGVITGKVNPDGSFTLNAGADSISDIDIKGSETAAVHDSSTSEANSKTTVDKKDTTNVQRGSANQVITNIKEKVTSKIKSITTTGGGANMVIIILVIAALCVVYYFFHTPINAFVVKIIKKL